MIRVPSHGSLTAKIALVGEAPGQQEEAIRQPFVGPAGNLLRTVVRDAGIDIANCRLMNVMEVRPPGNNFGAFYHDKSRTEPTVELLAGQERLRHEILQLKPNVIVALGGEPLKALTGKSGIKNWRGSIIDSPVGKVIPTLHPSYILRAYGDRPIMQTDFTRIKQESTSPLVTTQELHPIIRPTFVQVMEWLLRNSKAEVCTFDTETLGKIIRCLGLATSPTEALCIPFMHVERSSVKGTTLLMQPPSDNRSYWTPTEEAAILRELTKFFADTKTKFVAQNMSFDIPLMEENWGLRVRNLWMDTMHAQAVAYPELPKSLDFLTSVYTRIGYYADYNAGSDNSTWIYNCYDCMATFQCIDPILQELRALSLEDFYFRHVHKLVMAMARVQGRGVLIDVENRQRIAEPFKQKIEELRKWFLDNYELTVKKQVSPVKLKEILRKQHIRIPTRNRKEVTDARAIASLMAQHPDNPLFAKITEQREVVKFYGTYATAQLDEDNRMRTSYDVSRTPTGRLSSSKTLWGTGGNLQNIPHTDFRRLFIVPEDKVMLHADLSQAETRVVAWLSRDMKLIDRFINDPTFDVHRYRASIIYGVPEKHVTPVQRHRAKQCNHSGNYGIAWRQFAWVSGIPYQPAKIALEKHQSNPYLRGWWASIQAQLRRNRTLITPKPFERKRIFYGRLDHETFRKAYNYIPQSVVGDIINQACWKLESLLDESESFIILQVHDELDLEVPKTDLQRVARLVKKEMEVPLLVAPDLPELLIPVELSVGPNWWDQTELTM